jgi:hypothetical protein
LILLKQAVLLAALMIAYQSPTLPYRLNPDDYSEELRPLWHASRAHMSAMVPCKLWTGAKKVNGYGQCTIEGKTFYVHRLAWEEAYGPIPDGLCVCHFCDVPACINPHHLFLGTHTDNMRDMVAKGRQATGERHGFYNNGRLRAGEKNTQAKLTWDDIALIRLFSAAGATQPFIAKRYDVSQQSVSNIVTGKKWRESPEERRTMEEYWAAWVMVRVMRAKGFVYY